MAVQQVIALFVAGLLFCGFSSSAFSEGSNLGELEAKVRRFEARAPKGGAYDNALLDLYNAYVEAERDADAVSTIRKLWRLREKELGPSDDLTISTMGTVAARLARDFAGIEEALQILDQALSRLVRVPKRRPASEFGILEQIADVRSRILDPDGLTVEIDILERQTSLIERHLDAFDRDGLLAHRLRIRKFMDRIPKADAILRQRAQAVGRKAWLAHEVFVVNRWEAYRRSNKPRAAEEAHPAEALLQFYSNQVLEESGFFSRLFGGADIIDESMEPQSRATRALDVLPRVVEAELRLAHGKPNEFVLNLLSAIVHAASIAGSSAPREKLGTAARFWLGFTVESSGRYSHAHLDALNQIVAAYDAVVPGSAVDLAAERDTVSSVLEAGQLLDDALGAWRRPAGPGGSGGDAKAKLRTAVERSVAAFAKDEPALAEFIASHFQSHIFFSRTEPHEGVDTNLEVMKALFDALGPESRWALVFASEFLSSLVKNGREREAYLVGTQIAPRAELGLQDQLTQSIIREGQARCPSVPIMAIGRLGI